MTEWSVRCTSWTKPWKNKMKSAVLCTVYHYGLYDKFIFAIRLSPYRLFDFEPSVWASCLSSVYITEYCCFCCWMLPMVVAHSVGKLYRRQHHRWFSTYQRLSYARYEPSVAVIAIFSLRLLTCIPFPLCCCRSLARARSIFCYFQCELSSCHRKF